MKKRKKCLYCKEPILEDTFSKICRNCLTLKEIKKSINFKCQPPKSCFCCPYPDCVCGKSTITNEECKYFECAGLYKGKRGRKRKE